MAAPGRRLARRGPLGRAKGRGGGGGRGDAILPRRRVLPADWRASRAEPCPDCVQLAARPSTAIQTLGAMPPGNVPPWRLLSAHLSVAARLRPCPSIVANAPATTCCFILFWPRPPPSPPPVPVPFASPSKSNLPSSPPPSSLSSRHIEHNPSSHNTHTSRSTWSPQLPANCWVAVSTDAGLWIGRRGGWWVCVRSMRQCNATPSGHLDAAPPSARLYSAASYAPAHFTPSRFPPACLGRGRGRGRWRTGRWWWMGGRRARWLGAREPVPWRWDGGC